MTTFVLVPGAGGDTLFWHRLVAELEGRGHCALPVGLPVRDDSAGLEAYADTVVAAIGGRAPLVLVAQSMGGLTAPLVCDRVPVDLLVLVNAMVPRPGETGGEWWTATGQGVAAGGLARRPHPARGGTGGPAVPVGVPAPGGRGPTGARRRRTARWPPAGA